MKKLIPMAVAAMCMATVAFASVHHQSSVAVNPNRAIVDTVIPQDTTVTPTDTTIAPQTDTSVTPQETTPMEVSPVDTSTTTDTSSASH